MLHNVEFVLSHCLVIIYNFVISKHSLSILHLSLKKCLKWIYIIRTSNNLNRTWLLWFEQEWFSNHVVRSVWCLPSMSMWIETTNRPPTCDHVSRSSKLWIHSCSTVQYMMLIKVVYKNHNRTTVRWCFFSNFYHSLKLYWKCG